MESSTAVLSTFAVRELTRKLEASNSYESLEKSDMTTPQFGRMHVRIRAAIRHNDDIALSEDSSVKKRSRHQQVLVRLLFPAGSEGPGCLLAFVNDRVLDGSCTFIGNRYARLLAFLSASFSRFPTGLPDALRGWESCESICAKLLIDPTTTRKYVAAIRKSWPRAIAALGCRIETKRGIGYRLTCPIQVVMGASFRAERPDTYRDGHFPNDTLNRFSPTAREAGSDSG